MVCVDEVIETKYPPGDEVSTDPTVDRETCLLEIFLIIRMLFCRKKLQLIQNHQRSSFRFVFILDFKVRFFCRRFFKEWLKSAILNRYSIEQLNQF